jgi:predicted DNA-binding transcriptional regulator YafY
MADDKRSIRLLRLLSFLKGARYRTVEEMADRFGVSVRTIYRDVLELANSCPLENNPEGSGYRLMPGAELPPVGLSIEETALLRTLLEQRVVTSDPGLRKVSKGLAAKLAAAISALEETPAGLHLAPVDRSGPGAEQALAGLHQAVSERRAVEIVYESLSGKDRRPRPRGLEPWEVFHRGDAWYVVGLCRVHREARIFRLDRISAVGLLDEPAERPEGFDLDEFLGDSWEVFYGRGSWQVVLEFDAAVAPLVANARHHQGEIVERRRDGRVRYRVKLNALDEIARWVLGFGGAGRVLEPPELRRRVLALARAALEANGAELGVAAPRTRAEDPLSEAPRASARRRRST